MPIHGADVDTEFVTGSELYGLFPGNDFSYHHNTVDLLLMWCLRVLSYDGESGEQVHCMRQTKAPKVPGLQAFTLFPRTFINLRRPFKRF